MILKNESSQIIFFDLGWTLEDESVSQIKRAQKAEHICVKLGYNISFKEIIKFQDKGGEIGNPRVFEYALKCIGLSDDEINLVKRKAIWETDDLVLYPDAKEVLNKLNKKFSLGIIANQSVSIDNRLKKYQIYHLFKVIISSCNVKIEKPDMRIFKLALEKAEGNFKNVWMVGDRIDNDIIPAKELKWKSIRIKNGSHRLQEPKTELEKADFTIGRLKELLSIL